MLRKKKNKNNCGGWYYNTKFSDKISIMYGGLLSIVIISVCFLVSANAIIGYLNMRKDELGEALDIISTEVETRGFLTQHDIGELNLGPNVHAVVVDVSSLTTGSSADIITPALGTMIKIDKLSLEFKVIRHDEILSRFLTHIRPVAHNESYFFVVVEGTNASDIGFFRAWGLAFFIISSIGILGAATAGRYISRKMLKPILDITETAAAIGVEDLNRRIEYQGPDDEVKVLADTFNDMISRLQDAFDKQTRFISDASHELRTPISVIQGYAKLINRWGKEDPAILQESIDSIVDETDNMTMLIKNMLTLARYQQNQCVDLIPFSLNELTGEVIKEYEIMETNKDIILSSKEDLYIVGDFNLIKQMLRALVDNSIKYSHENNSPIEINIFAKDNMNCLSVSDKGTGIEEKDIPHIFERFYRADESRNKEIPGNGIGLSVAHTIIKKHGGKVFVESEVGKGTTILVQLPPLENNNSIDETNS